MNALRKLPHFRELDGIRGVAAVAVFIHHFLQPMKVGWFLGLARYGSSGVDVFFVLSGFLITSLLLIDREKPNYFHNFYWKRALRILPVYFVYLAFIGHKSYILLCLVFLANFADRFNVGFQSVAWTLSIEEQFYLIWPNFVRRLSINSLYYVAFGLVMTSVLLRVIMPLATGRMAIMYTPYRCDGLGLGAILALQWFEPQVPRPIQKVLSVLHSRWPVILAIVGIAVMACQPAESLLVEGARIGIVNYLAYRLIRRIIRPHTPTWLGRVVPVYFGRISYSFYLYHAIVLYLVTKRFDHSGLAFVVAFAATVAMSTVSLYAMELPIQRLRRFVLKS
jgi:peptidoglycan/LPS O-acetylase OafA/YrhL